MSRHPNRHAVVLAVAAILVATAGCGAPVAGVESPTPEAESSPDDEVTPTDDPSTSVAAANVSVVNGSLESDPGRVYDRLLELRNVTQPPPGSIRVRNLSDESSNTSGPVPGGLQPTQLWRYLDLSTDPAAAGKAVDVPYEGFVTARGSVVISLDEGVGVPTERLVLAHELTHYLQVQSGQSEALPSNLDVATTDGAYVRRSLVEGDAVFTTDAYLASVGVTDERNAPVYDRLQAQYPPGHAARYRYSRYVVGHDYVRDRIGDPAAMDRLYEAVPRSSEELLHGLAPGSEPPAALSVERSVDNGWQYVDADRMGEAFLRHALANELGADRAARVASGWGNDSLQIFRPSGGGDPSYAWVLRWDDASNATTFERGMRTALDELGTEEDDAWTLADPDAVASVERPTPETVVVALGDESFVRMLAVDADGPDVTIRTG